MDFDLILDGKIQCQEPKTEYLRIIQLEKQDEEIGIYRLRQNPDKYAENDDGRNNDNNNNYSDKKVDIQEPTDSGSFWQR